MIYLLNTGYLLLIINLVILIKGFSREGKAFKLFCHYIAAIAAVQVMTEYLRLRGINNIWMSHFYFVLQFTILSFFYRELLPKPLHQKIINSALIAVPGVIAVSYAADFTLWFRFNLLEIGITSSLIIAYSIFYFQEMLLGKKHFFMINTGLLIYLLGSTTFFLAGNYISRLSPVLNYWTWMANAFLYILYQFAILAECRVIIFKNK